MPQMNVTSQPRSEFAGHAFEFSRPVTLTRVLESATRQAFGLAVMLGTDTDLQVKPLSGPSDEVFGILKHNHFINTMGLLDATAPVRPGDDVGVVVDGIVAVVTEGIVTATSPVYVRHTSGGSTDVIGAFRADDDGGNASLVRNARFVRSDAEGHAWVYFRGGGFLDNLPALVAADPGDGGALPVDRSAAINLTGGSPAETRTLGAPSFAGQTLAVGVDAAADDIVVTASAALNVAGNTIATFSAAGQFLSLVAVSVGGALVWRVTANDGAALS